MVRRWLASATAAKHVYNENEQYVLKKKDGEMRVTPVDYLNTGVTLNNTVWCDGLHQFVELKHNLRLSTESLTTSFVSNVGYIALYGNRIFGMTGTLGSEAEQ
jgi:preprotein translocase subunit SecA